MKPYYQDTHVTQCCGNALDILAELPAESVQCCTTSPPYWGLRKYSGDQGMIWGCQHSGKELPQANIGLELGSKHESPPCEHKWNMVTPAGYRSTDTNPGPLQNQGTQNRDRLTSSTCLKCGAWKGAYGLEPTPEMYVEHTVEFLRAIRRVLRKDGVVFWNIGDSYATNHAKVGTVDKETGWTSATALIDMKERGRTSTKGHNTLKPKDLCLIPFRVALAAQADGWWVRSIIIWSKPNPMPESCKDRPTESHEYIIMLTKSSKYYWDINAVREANTEGTLDRLKSGSVQSSGKNPKNIAAKRWGGQEDYVIASGRNIRTVWTMNTEPFGLEMCLKCKTIYDSSDYHTLSKREIPTPTADNPDATQTQIWCICCRGWTDSPEDWLSHFAVFPTQLPRRCILAATSEKGNCSKCGKPWLRLVEKTKTNVRPHRLYSGKAYDATHTDLGKEVRPSAGFSRTGEQFEWATETLGWQPQCKCNAEIVPPIVLDPFSGAGTTGLVAKQLGRRAILIDTSEDYCTMSRRRIEEVPIPMML